MIKIHGVIGSWEVDPDEVVAEIEAQATDFEVDLNSVGGSVMGGIKIANAIRDKVSSGIKVNITGNAVVASIASYIAMQGSTFTVRDNTTFMYHNAWLPVVGDYVALRKSADVSEGLSSIIAKDYQKKTNNSLDVLKSEMIEEKYLYGEEIIARGFADDMKNSETDLNKTEALALAVENLKACNNAILQNEKLSIEAVAQLIPEDNDKIQKEAEEKKRLEDLEAKKVLDLQAKRKRDFILMKRK